MSEAEPTAARDASGKFRPAPYAGADAGLQAMRARLADLWNVSASLEARGRHSASLVATNCLVPFLVAANFQASGRLRLVQGLLVMASVLLSLGVSAASLRAGQAAAWVANPSTTAVHQLCQGARHAGAVNAWLLEALAAADPRTQQGSLQQAEATARQGTWARRALVGQAAAAVVVFALGFIGR